MHVVCALQRPVSTYGGNTPRDMRFQYRSRWHWCAAGPPPVVAGWRRSRRRSRRRRRRDARLDEESDDDVASCCCWSTERISRRYDASSDRLVRDSESAECDRRRRRVSSTIRSRSTGSGILSRWGPDGLRSSFCQSTWCGTDWQSVLPGGFGRRFGLLAGTAASLQQPKYHSTSLMNMTASDSPSSCNSQTPLLDSVHKTKDYRLTIALNCCSSQTTATPAMWDHDTCHLTGERAPP